MPTNAINSDIATLSKVLGRTTSELVIPSGVTRLGTYSLTFFTSLTSLSLPKSLTFAATNALSGCGNITSIVLENGFDCDLALTSLNKLTDQAVRAMVDAYKNNSMSGVTRTLTVANEVYKSLSILTIGAAVAKGLSIAVVSVK